MFYLGFAYLPCTQGLPPNKRSIPRTFISRSLPYRSIIKFSSHTQWSACLPQKGQIDDAHFVESSPISPTLFCSSLPLKQSACGVSSSNNGIHHCASASRRTRRGLLQHKPIYCCLPFLLPVGLHSCWVGTVRQLVLFPFYCTSPLPVYIPAFHSLWPQIIHTFGSVLHLEGRDHRVCTATYIFIMGSTDKYIK